MSEPLQTIEAFYAHALAIEREAAERYGEFEAYFADRGEAVLAAICGMLARMEAGHFAQLSHAAEGLVLPPVVANAFGWSDTAAESAPRKDFYRIMNAEQLLEIALEGEIRAQRFFAWVAESAVDATVRALAGSMAQEEDRHIRWVGQAIAYRNPLKA